MPVRHQRHHALAGLGAFGGYPQQALQLLGGDERQVRRQHQEGAGVARGRPRAPVFEGAVETHAGLAEDVRALGGARLEDRRVQADHDDGGQVGGIEGSPDRAQQEPRNQRLSLLGVELAAQP